MSSLPWRGLGLSSNLGERDLPHPYRLLDAQPKLFDFVEYSAPLELERARSEAALFPELWRRKADVPVLFHPVHLNLFGPTLESSERLSALDAHARAVGSAWVGNDVAWWHTGEEAFPGYLYLSPPLHRASVEPCVTHALHIQGALSMPLALENPAVIARRGDWHVLDFMAALHARTRLPLVLDMGHLWSHQLSAGLPASAGFDGFPFDQVIEIHIAGGVVTGKGARRFYADDHTQPIREELFELLADVLPRCTGLRALTYEGDGHPPEIAARMLRRLRSMLGGPRPDFVPHAPASAGAVDVKVGTAELLAQAYAVPLGGGADAASGSSGSGVSTSGVSTSGGAAVPAGVPASNPASERDRLFSLDPASAGSSSRASATGGGVGSSGAFVLSERVGAEALEPEAERAEREWRLAVLGEQVEREWPLTRWLTAPALEDLQRFAADPRFAQVFVDGQGTVADAFGAWARSEVLTRRVESGMAALSLESWAHTILAQRRAGEGEPPFELAPAVGVGTFPADLTELLFAVAALKRHLQARALTGGRPCSEGFEGLAGIGRRAGPGPWPLAVRRSRGRLELIPLTSEQARVLVQVNRGAFTSPPEALPAQDRATLDELLGAGLVVRR